MLNFTLARYLPLTTLSPWGGKEGKMGKGGGRGAREGEGKEGRRRGVHTNIRGGKTATMVLLATGKEVRDKVAVNREEYGGGEGVRREEGTGGVMAVIVSSSVVLPPYSPYLKFAQLQRLFEDT